MKNCQIFVKVKYNWCLMRIKGIPCKMIYIIDFFLRLLTLIYFIVAKCFPTI